MAVEFVVASVVVVLIKVLSPGITTFRAAMLLVFVVTVVDTP
jgi:hypothetical protein